MQKRVLAFLLVLTLVFSLLPVALVAAEEETAATPGYVVGLQKAHNQPSDGVAYDIYLQANTADQAAVTGYQFTVTPAAGLELGVPDTHTDGSLSANGAESVFVYSPTQTDAGFAVGTTRVRIATINLKGTATDTTVAPLTLTDITVTTGNSFYSDDADDAYVPDATTGEPTEELNEKYLGTVTQTNVVLNEAWADVTGEWTALDQATLDAIEETPSYKSDGTTVSYYYNTLPAGNYFLVEDIAATAQVVATNVNLDLNGYNFGTSSTNDRLFKAEGGYLNINDITSTGSALDGTLVAGSIVAANRASGGYYNCLWAERGSALTVANVNVDGSAVEAKDSGNLLYVNGENTTTARGTAVVTNVHFFGVTAYAEATVPLGVVEGRGDVTMNDVRFTGFDLTPNKDSDTFTNTLFSARHGSAKTGNLILNNVIAEECNNFSVYLKNTSGHKFGSVTVKGTTKLADPIYVENIDTKVTLDLDEGAEVTIETAELLTPEEFSQIAEVVDTLPAGTLFYKNAEQYVTYSNGAFDFSSHVHDDVAFKAWRDAGSGVY